MGHRIAGIRWHGTKNNPQRPPDPTPAPRITEDNSALHRPSVAARLARVSVCAATAVISVRVVCVRTASRRHRSRSRISLLDKRVASRIEQKRRERHTPPRQPASPCVSQRLWHTQRQSHQHINRLSRHQGVAFSGSAMGGMPKQLLIFFHDVASIRGESLSVLRYA